MPRMKDTHPQLYLAVICLALTHIGIGVAGFLSPKPSYLVSTPFIIFGVLLILGQHFWNYRTNQIIAIVANVYVAFYMFAFIPAFLLTFNNPQTRAGLVFIPLWFWFTITHYIIIKEPPINPASATNQEVEDRHE